MAEDFTDNVEVWTRSVSRGDAKETMEGILEQASRMSAEILVMDGDMVFGPDHVRSAVLHAAKAIAEGRNSSDSLAMETLLYASGERQLSSAIRKMSVGPETETVVVAVVKGRFAPGDAWSKLSDSDARVDKTRLLKFGITQNEMSTVADDRLSELVLEKVAAVDIIKK